MSHWHFILGAYIVTLVVVVVEILAVRNRNRVARELAEADELASAAPTPTATKRLP